MQCFESGEVLVLPREGGVANLEGRTLFRVLYSIEDILHHYDVKTEDVIRQFGAIPFVAQVPPGDELKSAEFYRHLPEISVAIPNFHITPQAGKANQQIKIYRQRINQTIKALNAEAPGGNCGYNVKVAIIDTGVDPSLLPYSNSLHHRQFATDKPDAIGTTPYDNVGHGTTVAYIVNQIAPAASILSVKMMDRGGNVGGLIAAIFLAEAEFKPDIYNLSLAVSCDLDTCGSCGNPLGPAGAINANQLGLLFGLIDKREIYFNDKPLLVAAAGNGSRSIMMPASFPNALAVGSYDLDVSALAPYSRYNSVFQDRFILAPGGLDEQKKAFGRATGNNFKRVGELFYGTSFSTAFVTGIAARYLCTTKGGPCVRGPLPPKTTTREYLMQRLAGDANITIQNYSPQSHGMGVVRYAW